MAETQEAKELVWSMWNHIGYETSEFLLPDQDCFSEDVEFYGPAPIGSHVGRDALFDAVYAPLAHAIPQIRRRSYIFVGGGVDGHTWVATAGNLVGALRGSWCGIDGQGADIRLRFGEFYRVVDGRVVEIRCLFDILGMAAQLGHRLLPSFPARGTVPPGPSLDNGLWREGQDISPSIATLQLMDGMVDAQNRYDGHDVASMDLGRFWHDDLRWYGPWGVGTAHGLDEFADWVQRPTLLSFPDRRVGAHNIRFADGLVGATTGWPSTEGTFDGEPFAGLEPTGTRLTQNSMSFFIRRGDKLHESWVLVDLVDLAAQCGADILAPLALRPT